MFAGSAYYPAGPSIHFLANEMVLSGFFRGVPLYTRTTIEPYSVVFVPAAGGMMRPYERPRSGDLAGTTGSSVPSLPVDIPTGFTPSTRLQAAGPPFVETREVMSASPVSLRQGRAAGEERAAPLAPRVGTGGRVHTPHTSTSKTGHRPANGIFVEFNNQRWFASAPPASLDPAALRRIGEWHGFPVYTSAKTGRSTIYIPVAQGSDAYAAYSRR
jgi:hypothetical protein